MGTVRKLEAWRPADGEGNLADTCIIVNMLTEHV